MFNNKTINIRQATINDKRKIAKLHFALWKSITSHASVALNKLPFSFFMNKWNSWLLEKNKVTLLAEKNGLLVGFICFEAQYSSVEIHFIYVSIKYRFSNLQKMLCEATFKIVSNQGFSKIYFNIAEENKSDLLLYRLMKGYTGEEKKVNQIFGFNFVEIRYEFNI